MTSPRSMLVGAVALLACLAMAGDAMATRVARRHQDGVCKEPAGATHRCAVEPSRPSVVLLAIQSTCTDENVLAAAKARAPFKARRLRLELDGQTIATSRRGRQSVAVGVDCGALAVGEHSLSVAVTRLDGTVMRESTTFRRLDAPSDEIY